MTLTEIAAWVGATSGLGGFALNLWKWIAEGPKLIIVAKPGMAGLRDAKKDQRYLLITIRNVGITRTTITTVSFRVYSSWLSRRRMRASESFVVPIPSQHQPLPWKLEVGEEWTGVIVQNEQLNKLIQIGDFWCEVYHSLTHRPSWGRVPKVDTSP